MSKKEEKRKLKKYLTLKKECAKITKSLSTENDKQKQP
jgi:hypothetical protein